MQIELTIADKFLLIQIARDLEADNSGRLFDTLSSYTARRIGSVVLGEMSEKELCAEEKEYFAEISLAALSEKDSLMLGQMARNVVAQDDGAKVTFRIQADGTRIFSLARPSEKVIARLTLADVPRLLSAPAAQRLGDALLGRDENALTGYERGVLNDLRSFGEGWRKARLNADWSVKPKAELVKPVVRTVENVSPAAIRSRGGVKPTPAPAGGPVLAHPRAASLPPASATTPRFAAEVD